MRNADGTGAGPGGMENNDSMVETPPTGPVYFGGGTNNSVSVVPNIQSLGSNPSPITGPKTPLSTTGDTLDLGRAEPPGLEEIF